MQKKYHLKACFVLMATLVIGAVLTRVDVYRVMDISKVLAFAFWTSSTVFASWMTVAYFRNLSKPLNNRSRVILSLFAGTIVSLLVAYLVIGIFPKVLLFPEMVCRPGGADILKHLINAFLETLVCAAIYNNIFTGYMLQRATLENAQLKQANLSAQIIALQQQLSPHFLFNSLSTLKTMATDSETKNFVVQLSHVYRYVLANKGRPLTTVAEELAFVNSYLYIQHQRFESALQVDLIVPDTFMNYEIPPLSVQLLIENAIKHNAFSPDDPLKVMIHVDSHENLVVSNSFRPKVSPEKGIGLGLNNISERFQLLFDKRIEISQTASDFTVTLPIKKA